MKRWSFVEVFNKVGNRNIRLVLSLIFILLATGILMALYEMALVVIVPGLTVWQSILYDIVFTSIMAPLVALFILLKFEMLYGKISKEIEDRKRAEEALKVAKHQVELYLDLMGHDINNLNQIALGYLELANSMVKDDEVKVLIKKPLDAIQNSSKLIENVRKLQKLEAGDFKIDVIELNSLLVELRNQYLNVPDKNVIIDYAPFQDCYVMANGLLKDVFSNLIGNAIKHSGPSKSVWIGLGLELYKNGREYYKVTVEDNGPGIPDVQKKNVLERFQDENPKTHGTGLGLYLVKTLVNSFNGSIHVEDRVPGDHTKGTRFVVILPAIDK